MRHMVLVMAALALSACGQQRQAAGTAQGCARTATRDVIWTNETTPDVVTTRSEGPSCVQAAVTFVVRNAEGDALWAFASTYYDLTAGGMPPEDAPAVSNEQMDAFLAGWADVADMRSSQLPEWREGVPTLTGSATTFAYDTPFDRDTYEMLRERNLRMICYAAAAEASQCLIVDPLSNAPTMIVAFGP
jgi:hypothetical protein